MQWIGLFCGKHRNHNVYDAVEYSVDALHGLAVSPSVQAMIIVTAPDYEAAVEETREQYRRLNTAEQSRRAAATNAIVCYKQTNRLTTVIKTEVEYAMHLFPRRKDAAKYLGISRVKLHRLEHRLGIQV